MFAMLDPNRSPMARSRASATAAVTSVASSGSEVREGDDDRSHKQPTETGVFGDLIADSGESGAGRHHQNERDHDDRDDDGDMEF